jgi:hypothetical protein
MDEVPSVVRHLHSDFTEQNTALFCFLGLLSTTRRLTRALEAEAKQYNNYACRTELRSTGARIDYLILGLISFSKSVARVATVAAAAERVPVGEPPPLPSAELRDLLR